ncbi:tRNA (adenosine(37)-N6)-threonylcarbamoyltransferase complex ATPase subunit type 1 TsaE [Legionella waltersii]|uniref:tRNA threonylcarbamoyladenosine biosynthesis protein TsaE n=1 Tax=Legionella waltersii TaxID=66969 RepID=A0A0W1ADP6_9GAMM|nr:tRNA (adenosine(37)-N6)-threonylcarbamoyltransferase complex ATPase subunit type 1 TsaE [Legionella waltersii]KTD79296.1 ATPase or kinase [Legionella waltersii]SNV12944.1 ATPase or kinase [Legionella waltersii]
MSNSDVQLISMDLIGEEASQQFAKRLALFIVSPLVLTFSGEIGAGKTTIIRSLINSLGIHSAIKSPTFSLVESYHVNNLAIHHFDLYRIDQEEELEYLGFRDYFTEHSVCLIEWPEHAGKSLPSTDIRFNLVIKGAARELRISALSATGRRIVQNLSGES